MLRGRGAQTSLFNQQTQGSDLGPATPIPAQTTSSTMSQSQPVRRTPSFGSPMRIAAPIANADDPEAGGSPKKADIPSHRRKNPLLFMALLLFIAAAAGAALFLSHDAARKGRAASSVAGSGAIYVQFTAPGLYVPLKDALDVDFPLQPQEQLLHESPTQGVDHTIFTSQEHDDFDGSEEDFISLDSMHSRGRGLGQDGKSTESGGAAPRLAAATTFKSSYKPHLPKLNGIRLLIAVTSACCTEVSMQRRAAIRRTWKALAQNRYPRDVHVLFFLAQPKNSSIYEEWLPVLEQELLHYNDTVVVRGKDEYLNLPNKTFRTFRYALAHPVGYTHVFKADDDTWVRPHRLIETLYEARPLSWLKRGSPAARKPDTATNGRRIQKLAEEAQKRKKELEEMSKQRNAPIVSDGMMLFDASSIVKRVNDTVKLGLLPNNTYIDDVDGSKVSVSTVAKRAGWKMARKLSENESGAVAEKSLGNWAENDEKEEEQEEEEESRTWTKNQHPVRVTEESKEYSWVLDYSKPQMNGIYLGCMEVQSGFHPIRDPGSKWYVSESDLPDSDVPLGVQYLAGWGYVLSRDLLQHVVQKVNAYDRHPDQAPKWFKLLQWEDVLVGALVADVISAPQSHPAFRPPWRSCAPGTAVRHLDVDSPKLLAGLVEQDISGLADEKAVQCSSGQFLPGDYSGWFAWKHRAEMESGGGS